MRYESPQALEMAVKDAAKKSPTDTNQALAGFFYDRFLCRVFSIDDGAFVLKGGLGMLARTIDARATRDMDLLSQHRSLESALAELQEVASTDLGDYVIFIYEGSRPIKETDEYRSGLNVRFTPWLGIKRFPQISIDLVVDEIHLDHVQTITPANRLPIDGLQITDYQVYPVENALADKLCAIIETHDGRASTRVKDLVDVVIYAITCPVERTRLRKCIRREAAARKLTLPETFNIPAGWSSDYRAQYARLCTRTAIPDEYRTLEAAEKLVRRLFDPILDASERNNQDDAVWNHEILQWEHPGREQR